jgi:hypothetical protein
MTSTVHHSHVVTAAIDDVQRRLSDVADAPVWSLNPSEATAALAHVGAATAQLAELEARLLVHVEQTEVPGRSGATSTANWHAAATRTTRPHAHRTVRLAHGLDTHEPTRAALAAGTVHVEQAEVIVRALDDLPDDLDPEVARKAELHLLDLAPAHDARALKRLGRRILEVVSPEAADAHEARLLEREEREAEAATRLTVWTDSRGLLQGRFTLDGLSGAMFTKALHAFAAPKHRASQGPHGERRPTPERLGRAFAEMIQRFPTKKLPKAGGLNATVVVLMGLETLMGGLEAAELDTGLRISPGAARRLACEAGIIPAVLGGRSQVLDLGRKRRFHNEAQRIAKTIEARGCEIDGCDSPPSRAEMHHPDAWSKGGRTDLANATLICPPHHRTAHDPRFTMRRLPTGKYSFHRRT